MTISDDHLKGVGKILGNTGSFAQALTWLDRQLAARRARQHGTRCPDCGQTECICDAEDEPSSATIHRGAEPQGEKP